MSYPQEKKSPRGTSTRLTKKISNVLKPDSSLIKSSRGGRGDRKDSKQSLKKGDKERKIRSSVSAKDKQKSEKIYVKVADQVTSDGCTIKGECEDKARKLKFLIESLNKGKEEKIKEQNKLHSTTMKFSQVVNAVVAHPSDIMSEPTSSNHDE